MTRDRRGTAEMLVYIDEIDRREVWASAGCSSTFGYCVERFHFSESQASKRIWAARTARRFPVIFGMVGRGEIHLSAVNMLARHLTGENHRDVLARATHRTIDQCKELVAELAPKPDVPTRVRALPTRAVQPQPEVAATPPLPLAMATATALEATPAACGATITPAPAPELRAKGRVEPLAPRRYKLELTIGQEMRDKLTELQELLSHQVPDGDPAVIVERAFDALLEQARRQRTRATERARPRRADPARERTRSVPAEVVREVWRRDDGQCAFVAPDGKRCGERRFLEQHHKVPYARGGPHTADNIELRCRAHNQHQANLDYGRAFMDSKRRPDQARESLAPYAPRALDAQSRHMPYGMLPGPPLAAIDTRKTTRPSLPRGSLQ